MKNLLQSQVMIRLSIVPSFRPTLSLLRSNRPTSIQSPIIVIAMGCIHCSSESDSSWSCYRKLSLSPLVVILIGNNLDFPTQALSSFRSVLFFFTLQPFLFQTQHPAQSFFFTIRFVLGWPHARVLVGTRIPMPPPLPG